MIRGFPSLVEEIKDGNGHSGKEQGSHLGYPKDPAIGGE